MNESHQPPKVEPEFASDRWRAAQPVTEQSSPAPIYQLKPGEIVPAPPIIFPEESTAPEEKTAEATAAVSENLSNKENERDKEVAKVTELVLKYGTTISAPTLREKLSLPLTATSEEIKKAGLRAIVELTPTFSHLIKREAKILEEDKAATLQNPIKPDGTRDKVMREVYLRRQETEKEIQDQKLYELVKSMAGIMQNAFEEFTGRGSQRETLADKRKRDNLAFITEMVVRKNEDTLANIIRSVDNYLSVLTNLRPDLQFLIQIRSDINLGKNVDSLVARIQNPALVEVLKTVVPNTETKRKQILEKDKQEFDAKLRSMQTYDTLVSTLKNGAVKETGRGTSQQYLDALVSLKTEMDKADEVEINTTYSSENNEVRLGAVIKNPELVTHFSGVLNTLREQMLREKEGLSEKRVQQEALNMIAGVTDIKQVLEILLTYKSLSSSVNTMRVILDRARREVEANGEAAFFTKKPETQDVLSLPKINAIWVDIKETDLRMKAKTIFDGYMEQKISGWKKEKSKTA